MTKFEKDAVIDAVLIFYDIADGNKEKFLALVEKFRNEKPSPKPAHDSRD